MLLKEFFYFDKQGNDFEDDKRFDSQRDISVVKPSDTRKTRLTLEQLNQIRRTSEAREIEQAKELDFIQSMYGQPAQEEATL
jgi:acetyl-CoA carboxylase alpha subunit